MATTTKNLKYTDELGEQFISWNAVQNLKEQNLINANGKVEFKDWRDEISKIKSYLMFSKTSTKQYALKECPNRWNEFLEMKQEKSEKQTKLD